MRWSILKALPRLLGAALAWSALTTSAPAVYADQGGPPFAGDPDAKVEEKRPAVRTWTVNAGGYSFSLEFVPGIPEANQMVEVIVSVSQIPKTPHPRYGNRIPEADARVVVEFKNTKGESEGRFLAHALPLTKGQYGLHFTPSQDGLYDLVITGATTKGTSLRAETKLPVNVWPLPDSLKGEGADAGGRRRRRPIIRPK